MPEIRSIEDLKRLREEALKIRNMKASDDKVQVIVSMGTVGIAAGARETLKSILNFVEANQVADIIVRQTGNLGVEGQDPVVQVILPGQEKVTYGKVHASVVERIMREHVCDGQVVTEFKLAE